MKPRMDRLYFFFHLHDAKTQPVDTQDIPASFAVSLCVTGSAAEFAIALFWFSMQLERKDKTDVLAQSPR